MFGFSRKKRTPRAPLVDDVDPLAEAEVYLAYGRSEQARSVLEDGLARYPDRADLKAALENLGAGRSVALKASTALDEAVSRLPHLSQGSQKAVFEMIGRLHYLESQTHA